MRATKVATECRIALTIFAFSIFAGCLPPPAQTPSAVGSAAAASPSSAAPSAPATSAAKRPQHVFIIVFENKDFDDTFGPNSPAPYLAKELPAQGQLLRNYYAIGHQSLDNYIAMISGQAPNQDTQRDCPRFSKFERTAPDLNADGQAVGDGCVYPSDVFTVANQLETKNLKWGAYMESMPGKCRHPRIGFPDETFRKHGRKQYATRHNPFVYFCSIIDTPSCNAHDVPLGQLEDDLKSVATTPNLVFITPNLCNDAHDNPCEDHEPGGLVRVDPFLKQWVPKIQASPAFQQDGLLIVTFDEAEAKGRTADRSRCCDEPTGPNTSAPGGDDGRRDDGPGGGRIGAVLISRFVKPGIPNDTAYNHYSLLKSIEDLFDLRPYLGFAGQKDLPEFGSDVYNQPQP